MDWNPSCRRFLRASTAVTDARLLQACGTGSISQPAATNNSQKTKPVQPINSSTVHHGDNVLYVATLSGLAEDINRVNIGLTRLYNVSFIVTSQEAGPRRYQRSVSIDAQRIADSQDVVAGRVKTPKVSMGLRSGYGVVHILSHIDFALLGARMRGRGAPFSGSSDVCAVQLALLAKGNVFSFAGSMMHNEFGKPQPDTYTMGSFIRGPTSAGNTVDIPVTQRSGVNAEDTFWGNNFSVLASLADSLYTSDIQGGILLIEDAGEQPYCIECVLNTLYLAEVLRKQRAIVFGDLRIGIIRGICDSSYDFLSVVSQTQRTIHVPVLIGFPFGHTANKSAFPLGAHAKIRSLGNGGYSVTSDGYPTFNAATLNPNSLLPPSVIFDNYVPVGSGATEEALK